MMKKLIAYLLVLALAVSLLAGCTPSAMPETPAAPVQEPAPAEPETPAAPAEPAAPESVPQQTEPYEEYDPPMENGKKRLVLYWSKPGTDYTKCDVWSWWNGGDGKGYEFHRCAYGVKCLIDVPEAVEEVGFIVRTDCSDPCGTSWGDAKKDYDGDRFAILTGEKTEIYLKTGDANQYYSSDGGVTLAQVKLFSLAAIVSLNQITYNIAPAMKITSLDQIHVREGDREIPIESLSSLNNTVVLGTLTLAEELDITKEYTVSIEGFEESKIAIPTTVFDSAEFAALYNYEGDDLGAVLNGGETTFKVWAPTASCVVLNLFEAGDGVEAYKNVDMVKGEKGVWSHTEPCGQGTYYTYSVTTAVGTQEAVDPYAKAVGVNGDRGMVIDLSLTDPAGFRESGCYQLEDYSDAVIWEVHVRDFSNTIASSEYPGKYLAFTETGLKNSSGIPVGMDYVKALGVTHIHLNPVYDFATVDESSDAPQFNWGYDPKNYNAPEGSYSTDPYHGEVRVNEFKQMVQNIHNNGMGVIMDVVYNHTYDKNANLNKIVPYYYYRYTYSGANSNGSGCGNETASERYMFRRFMLDSVLYWAQEYKVDGFRFDLMGLHDVETMQLIEQALHKVNPSAIIYGEGWTGGTSALNSNKQAVQANMNKIKASEGAAGGIAVFNDAIRDGLKGSVFDPKDTGYVNGSTTKSNANRVSFGITGGVKNIAVSWGVADGMVINYMSCHDNLTLWDKLLVSVPDASEEALCEMNRLGAAIVLFSKGTPFMLAGEEMLRSKDGDSNSYASSDAVNNLRWELLTENSPQLSMTEFYRALIRTRKENADLFRGDAACEVLSGNAILASYSADGEIIGYLLVNPTSSPMDPADYIPDLADYHVIFSELDSGEAAPMSVCLYRK